MSIKNVFVSNNLFWLYLLTSMSLLQIFEYLVDEFLAACDGLPLSLKVVGAFLYGENDKSYQEDQFKILLGRPIE